MKKIRLGVFSLLFFSCNNNSTNQELKQQDNYLNKYLRSAGTYGSQVLMPNDTLLFGFSKNSVTTDSSYTLLVIKSADKITGRYHIIPPDRITGFDGYIDESIKAIYYEGFVFNLNETKWDSIRSAAQIKDYQVKDTNRYTGCLHCPRYSAYYDSKFITSSKSDVNYLERLDTLLHEAILDELVQKKKHPRIENAHTLYLKSL